MSGKQHNQWARYTVAREHRYLDDASYTKESNKHHKVFSKWLNTNFSGENLKIIDIGCGNGRVLEIINNPPTSILNNINYIGYDINTFCLDKAIKRYKNCKNVKFIELDIDYEKIDEKVDIIYIDSILPMLKNPYKTVLELLNICDYIFFNRTTIHLGDMDDIQQTNEWAGMDKEQVSWVMVEKKLNNFLEKNNLKIEVLDYERIYLNSTIIDLSQLPDKEIDEMGKSYLIGNKKYSNGFVINKIKNG